MPRAPQRKKRIISFLYFTFLIIVSLSFLAESTPFVNPCRPFCAHSLTCRSRAAFSKYTFLRIPSGNPRP